MLLHCAERSAKAFLSLLNDNKSLNKNVLAHSYVYRSFCVPKDKSNPLAIRFWRTAGFEPAKRELYRLKNASVLLAYTLEYPGAPL